MGTPLEHDLACRLPRNLTDLKVLNLGAGYCASPISSQILQMPFKSLTNVEIWPGAFVKLQAQHFAAQTVHNELDDAYAYAIRYFERSMFDVVLMIDFIEHLEKYRGMMLLDHCRVISKSVVIFVPIGLCPQDAYDGNDYQRHMSTWNVTDFVGASIEVFPDMHKHFNPPVSAAWVVYGH